MEQREIIEGFGGVTGVVPVNEICPELDGEEFKDVTANTLTVGPNDIVVLFTPEYCTQEVVSRIGEELKKHISCRDVWVLDGCMKIGVIKEGE